VADPAVGNDKKPLQAARLSRRRLPDVGHEALGGGLERHALQLHAPAQAFTAAAVYIAAFAGWRLALDPPP
jgi:hypothetical protein